MPNDITFESLKRVEPPRRILRQTPRRTQAARLCEAQLRDDFLNPFFRALAGTWKTAPVSSRRNAKLKLKRHADCGGRKRADIFSAPTNAIGSCARPKNRRGTFRPLRLPSQTLCWNKDVWMASHDFEELKIYIVGSKPYLDEPHVGEWKSWTSPIPAYRPRTLDLLARDKIATAALIRR